jgi:hypothetical protein
MDGERAGIAAWYMQPQNKPKEVLFLEFGKFFTVHVGFYRSLKTSPLHVGVGRFVTQNLRGSFRHSRGWLVCISLRRLVEAHC